jgi:hypothetical protein
MVCAQLHFEAIFGLAEGHGHYTGVIAQDVYGRQLLGGFSREGVNGVEACEVQLHRFQPGLWCFGTDAICGMMSFGHVAACEDDPSTCASEGTG